MSTDRKTAARQHILTLVQPGDTVFTIVRHVARSGMMRVIDLYVIKDNTPLRITWSACEVTGATYNRKHEGMVMHGCGMDMCFEAVYRLGGALWPEGTPTPHSNRNGKPDSSGGYALRKQDL